MILYPIFYLTMSGSDAEKYLGPGFMTGQCRELSVQIKESTLLYLCKGYLTRTMFAERYFVEHLKDSEAITIQTYLPAFMNPLRVIIVSRTRFRIEHLVDSAQIAAQQRIIRERSRIVGFPPEILEMICSRFSISMASSNFKQICHLILGAMKNETSMSYSELTDEIEECLAICMASGPALYNKKSWRIA